MKKSKTCYFCGKKFDTVDENFNFSIDFKAGYGSKYDGDKFHIHACCDCFDKLVDKSFK